MQISEVRFRQTVSALMLILQAQQPADVMLSQFFRANKSLGSIDRSFVAESVFAILRRRIFIEHLCHDVTSRRMCLAYFCVICKHQSEALRSHLRPSEVAWLNDIRSISSDQLSLSLRADLPEWITKKLAKTMDAREILSLGESLQQPASLDLRVNTLLADRDSVINYLSQRGILAEPTPFSPIGIRLKSKPALNRDPLFLSGKIEVQDEGSQLLCYLVQPKRRDMVVDFCAGAGGKTLTLGAMMESQGRIYAFDVSEKRISRLKPRLRRSELSNVYAQRIDSENDLRIKRLQGKIDKVLVDAPCSGLGTLRRNPDLKFRQDADSLLELCEKQFSILNSAAKLLKTGGRLVYATCSFLPEENQKIVDRFLFHNPNFVLLNCAEILKSQKIDLHTGRYLELKPQVHHTDSFFAATLEKTGNAVI